MNRWALAALLALAACSAERHDRATVTLWHSYSGAERTARRARART